MKDIDFVKILRELNNTNTRVACYMANLNQTLEKINDQNVLHTEALRMNTQAIQDVIGRFVKLLLLLVGALILLAGAEKVFKIVGI